MRIRLSPRTTARSSCTAVSYFPSCFPSLNLTLDEPAGYPAVPLFRGIYALTLAMAIHRQIRMRVFMSSQDVDGDPCSALISTLRSEGWVVDHSPRNPIRGHDPRWSSWYASGLAAALTGADVFIVVLDYVWDSSSWMAEEAHFAIERGMVKTAFYWNPQCIVVRAMGMRRYLRSELPRDMDALVQVLREHAAA